MLLGLVLLGALFGAGGTWLAERAAPGELGPVDKARIGAEVRAYLLANPDVIPLALQRLRDRETGRIVAGSRRAIETPVGSAWAGNPKGDVTVVEYYDYNCGYCRAVLPIIDQLIKSDPNVRVVYRELPVLAPSSRDAARASIQAAEQGKFARFHQALYAGGRVTTASIAAAARTAGVDLSKRSARADRELAQNLETAQRLGMSGTPSWVIGDRVVSGALPLDQLKEAVAAARAR
jgi:protein-disulfide isomerase